jgi:hypothetical protein
MERPDTLLICWTGSFDLANRLFTVPSDYGWESTCP